ncbi:MAG: hypothetical protein IJ864_02020 [Alphaproteobacteria bacterium]|nr:hypothetical protein [Alphaproteobacteria bacterium]
MAHSNSNHSPENSYTSPFYTGKTDCDIPDGDKNDGAPVCGKPGGAAGGVGRNLELQHTS